MLLPLVLVVEVLVGGCGCLCGGCGMLESGVSSEAQVALCVCMCYGRYSGSSSRRLGSGGET